MEQDVQRTGVERANINVDCGRRLGELPRLWTTFGYDELNWTYTPRGKRALETFSRFATRPFHVRAHNITTSGRGFSWPHWGSGNIYHEDAAGNPVYDFTIADQVFDAYVAVGFKPIVELGFTPAALVPEDADLPYTHTSSQYGRYEAGLCFFPPKDNQKWQDLCYALAKHCVERYGAEEVGSWYWECWNEPDIGYWRGTPEQYYALYDHTVAGLTRALPTIKVGGPAVAGGGQNAENIAKSARYLDGFLAHCAGGGEHGVNAVTGNRGTQLDFITFHAKGSSFGKRYGPLSDDGMVYEWGTEAGRVQVPRLSPSRRTMLTKIREHLSVASKYPQFRHLPLVLDEFDPCVPAHSSRYDNPNFGFRNTPYYASIMASAFKKLMDLNESIPDSPPIALATSWSFYFEGERFFEAFREFFTAENVELPVLNGYRMLERLGSQRLALTSDTTWDIAQLDELADPNEVWRHAPGSLPNADVDGLAAIGQADSGSNQTLTVLVWHHVDDQYASAPPAEVTVSLRHLSFDPAAARVRHWRIDAEHSNAYTIWQRLGRPQDPTPEQLTELKQQQGLEEGPAVQLTPSGTGEAHLHLSLPLHALSLLEISAP